MIAASEPQEFVPNGRQHIKNHPGPVVITSDQNQLKYDSFLAHRFSQVNLDDNLEGERWELRRAPDSLDGPLVEEELFIHGCTVVVSRGSVGHSLAFGQNDKSSGRKVIVTYTMEAPIKYALWVTFLDIRDNNYLPMPSLCIIDSDKISVYLEAGDEYTTPLQFKVASAWATKYGLLLERVSHCHTDGSPDPALTLTTLFSVIHPLHEISPILSIKQGGILTYMNDPCLKVIYTSTEPSLCLIFDVRTGYHSIWKIRRALSEECHWMCGQNSGITIQTSGHHNLSCSPGSAHLSASLRQPALNRSSAFMTGHSGSGSSSLFNKTSNSHGTLYHSTSPHSISFYRSHSAGNSPRLSPRQSPCSSSVSSIEARLGGSIAPQVTEPKPIVPELCLEYVWSETSSPSTMGMDIRNRAAGKAFLSRDTLGQDYLCYLVKSSTLTMVRLGHTNTKEPELIVGTVSQIIAKDAVPIPALDMIAVLETGGCVLLYTGTTQIGKVHIAGVSAQLSSSTYLTTISNVTRINSPFPKRSSLMSSTRLGDELFDDTAHVSPGGGGGLYYHLFFDEAGFGTECHPRDSIQAVRDPVAARFTLEYSSGIMFRFTLPEFSSSPLVTECIKVLKSVLQKDVALLTMAKWYTIRNAPGTQDISPKQEWQLFISAILGLIGYQLDTLPLMEYYLTTDCDSPAKNCKKMRGSNLGSANDWNYLISSSFHENMSSQLGLTLGLHCDVKVHSNDVPTSKPDLTTFNTSSPLYPFMYLILFSFHLLYEEIKLEPVLYDSLPLLVKLLYQLSTDLRLNHYCQYYWRDFPHDCQINTTFISQLPECELVKLSKPQFMSEVPPSVFEHILCLIMGILPQESYPCITGVNSKSRTIIEIIGILSDTNEEHLKSIVPPGSRSVSPQPTINLEPGTDIPTPAHKAVMFMAQRGLEREDLLNLPCGVGLILGEAIQTVTENPCQSWPDEVYRLISRSDLLPLSKVLTPLNYKLPLPSINSPPLDTNTRETDQMLQLRFSKDQRVNEVRRLLQSSEPVTIAITQRPEVSDHEFIEEQERHLYAICTRTMALPVGRGMMDLHTTEPVVTEQLNIPRLCLSGRAPPRGTSVELSHIEVVPNMNLWPLFHNGVAAGLRISPHAKNIESAWILFNKPKNGTDALPEHAGFVMALGLSGHLNNLMQIYLYNYLNKCHEMTSVGVLLGLAASKRGTMDIRATKLFSLHIESLLPPTSIELDLVQNIQVAALLGIGLVYQGTAHRHIAEALLSEIGRPPGPEMENSSDRECYSLAAGLGLGLVVLGRGNDPTGLADLDIADTLQYYMVGGHKRPLTGSQKEKYKSPSYQIREGDCVNNHVTGPGATLALGMMYFNTGNMAVAHWLEAPDSEYMLDFICPDQLLLRMIARGLVLWEHILPTKAWVEGHVPHTIRPYCLVKPRDNMEHVDLETMNQAYCNIIAGACMAMGLRFAGSANNQAFETLLYYCKLFTSISSKSIAELAGKSTIETCICVTLLSLAMVMAGTGDLEVMRLCRHLGSRLSQLTNSVVTYGSHLAVHMALGLLYLGGGALTLSTSPEAIAALICAFFPRFPTHSNDNRYHLQAFRHLYVLAVEHRLFLPRDIDTGQLCFAHIKVIFLDTPYYKNQEVTLFAPTLLPELHLLSEVRVHDDRYWPIVFTRGKNWHQLEELLSTMDSIGVKLRAGCLPYTDDPHGYKTLLAQTLSTETATSWAISASSILGFTSDKKMTNFTKYFLELCEKNAASTDNELKLVQWLSNICYECVTRNKLPLLDFWNIILLDVMRAAGNAPCSTVMWQMKLVLAQGLKRVGNHHTSFEHFQAISQYLTAILDTWEREHTEILSIYMKCGSVVASSAELMKLSSYLIFYGIPLQSHLTSFVDLKLPSILQLANRLNQFRLQPTTIKKIWFLYNFSKEGNNPVT